MDVKTNILLIVLLGCLVHVQAQLLISPYDRLLKEGDNMEWAQPDFDDKDWDPEGSTYNHGNFWVRFKITCDASIDAFEEAGLHIVSMGSYELYWDGILIGKNGIVGKNRAEEVPGKFLSQKRVPDSLLSQGIHSVAFRVSNHHMPPLIVSSWNMFYLEEYKATERVDLIITAKIFILAGIYLMAAIYYLFLFLLRNREKESLIFSIMCFLFFALILMEYLKFLYAYTFDFHYIRLLIIFSLTFFISFLTPFFFINFFKIPNRVYLCVGILALLIITSFVLTIGADPTNQSMALIMWLSSLGILIYASIKKKKDSWVILLALLVAGAVVALHNMRFRFLLYSYDITLFVSFSILVLSMMYLLARRAKEQKNAYEASLLLSARLQNELLKKNIQPHFIMNTLTSLMEWIEESPKESIKFIEALSKEFEIVSDIAEKKLIPIEQEIALCKHHIEIMKFRKEVDYGFTWQNIPEGEQIPPAIFHTLIENGISHSRVDKPVNMVLNYSENKEAKIYELRTFAMNRKATAVKEGTGFKYIKSRLVENYGEQWKLASHETEDGWVTILHLYKKGIA